MKACLIFLIAVLGLSALAGVVPNRRLNFKPVAASGATYLLNQNFEGTGYDNGETWTESGAGTINEDYTTTVLEGSQSLLIAQAGSAVNTTYSAFTGFSTTCYVYLKLHIISGSTTNARVFSLRNSSGTAVCSVIFGAGGFPIVRAGSAGGGTTVASVSAGTTYEFWVSFIKGTGANAVGTIAFSSDGTKPTSGNNFAQVTSGDATTDPARFMLGADSSSGLNLVYDKVRVDDAVIGVSPP